MEISVRSYLTAGVAAVVGATAIGLSPAQSAPALPSVALPASTVAEIALTGTSIPWETIAAVVQAISSGGSLQEGVTALIGSIGAEFAREALPIVTAAAGDVVKYVGTALAELLSGPDAPQIDFEAIIAAATAAISAGNLPGAVQALASGLSAPLTQIGQVLFTPEFQDFVFGKVGSVLGALPEILRAAVETVVGIDIKPLIDALSGLLGGIFPAASVVAAPRALAAAAAPAEVPAAVAESVAAPAAPVEAPAAPAPDTTPASDAAPDAAPADDTAPDAAPAADNEAPAVEAPAAEAPAVEAPAAEAPATEVVEATEVESPEIEALAPEIVAPETTSAAATKAAAPQAAEPQDDAPAATPRGAKPGPRHSSQAKSARG